MTHIEKDENVLKGINSVFTALDELIRNTVYSQEILNYGYLYQAYNIQILINKLELLEKIILRSKIFLKDFWSYQIRKVLVEYQIIHTEKKYFESVKAKIDLNMVEFNTVTDYKKKVNEILDFASKYKTSYLLTKFTNFILLSYQLKIYVKIYKFKILWERYTTILIRIFRSLQPYKEGNATYN